MLLLACGNNLNVSLQIYVLRIVVFFVIFNYKIELQLKRCKLLFKGFLFLSKRKNSILNIVQVFSILFLT